MKAWEILFPVSSLPFSIRVFINVLFKRQKQVLINNTRTQDSWLSRSLSEMWITLYFPSSCYRGQEELFPINVLLGDIFNYQDSGIACKIELYMVMPVRVAIRQSSVPFFLTQVDVC